MRYQYLTCRNSDTTCCCAQEGAVAQMADSKHTPHIDQSDLASGLKSLREVDEKEGPSARQEPAQEKNILSSLGERQLRRPVYA